MYHKRETFILFSVSHWFELALLPVYYVTAAQQNSLGHAKRLVYMIYFGLQFCHMAISDME
jgi:hypothetical protein